MDFVVDLYWVASIRLLALTNSKKRETMELRRSADSGGHPCVPMASASSGRIQAHCDNTPTYRLQAQVWRKEELRRDSRHHMKRPRPPMAMNCPCVRWLWLTIAVVLGVERDPIPECAYREKIALDVQEHQPNRSVAKTRLAPESPECRVCRSLSVQAKPP